MPSPRSRVEPRLTVRAMRPLLSALRDLGQDPDAILRSLGVEPPDYDDPDARVPMSVGPALLAYAAEVTGDEHVGLHMAEKTDLGSFEVLFYSMVSSPTLGAAYERVCRYQGLINDAATVALEPNGGRGGSDHARGEAAQLGGAAATGEGDGRMTVKPRRPIGYFGRNRSRALAAT